MKKLTTILATTAAAALITGCTTQPSIETATKLDTKVVCSVEKNGIKKVIETAEAYNNIAKAEGLEFRRLGVNNTDLIISVQEAIKTGATEVNPVDNKGKASKTKLETNYAAERACKFGIAALQQSVEAKSTWRKAVPGDGMKY